MLHIELLHCCEHVPNPIHIKDCKTITQDVAI